MNFFIGSIIHILHIDCKLLLVPINHIFTKVPDLIHYSYLSRGLGENGTDGICKLLQVIYFITC